MAFRGDSTDTYTYASGSTGGTVDLGARNTYRYINASNVYNKGKSDGVTTHTGTYTFPANDTGGTKDLGVNHSYRYVNAQNVYNKGVSNAPKKTLLWTNPNLNADFTTQTISLNLANYTGIVIERTINSNYSYNEETYISKAYVEKGESGKCVYFWSNTANGGGYCRWVTVTSSSVWISECKSFVVYYHNASEPWNVNPPATGVAIANWAIPKYIYGVR